MDPLTHALSGLALKQTGFRRNAAAFVLVLSALAPDIDYVSRFWGAEAFLHYHRGITHGVFVMVLFSLLIGFCFRNKGGFFYYTFLSLIGYGTHLLLDLSTQFGTRILSPLDWNRYSLDLVSFIDPYITLGLLAVVVFPRLIRKRPVLAACCILALLLVYVGGRYYMQDRARHFLKSRIDANVYRVYPIPNALFRWWFVVRSGDDAYTGIADLYLQKVFFYKKYSIRENDPVVAASKISGAVRTFLSFAKNPFPEVRRTENGSLVLWRELSFSFLSGDHFMAEVEMDSRGKIIRSGLSL